MYRYRTSAGDGMVFGHEITGLVVERGPSVEIIQLGDIVSVPFNFACGLCASCVHGLTQLCLRLNPNPLVAGAIPGYADMGGWKGGQAEYVMVPYADFNLLLLPKDPTVLAESHSPSPHPPLHLPLSTSLHPPPPFTHLPPPPLPPCRVSRHPGAGYAG